MPANIDDIDHLNIIRDEQPKNDNLDEEQLRLFSNTQFYDLDMGQNTDIGTTVDELLMQQEKEIQFPQKQQPLDDEAAGSSGVDHHHHYLDHQREQSLHELHGHQGFDLDELQQFSLAGDISGYPYLGGNERTPAAMHTAHRQNWYKSGYHAAEIPTFQQPPVARASSTVETPILPQQQPLQLPQQPQGVHTPVHTTVAPALADTRLSTSQEKAALPHHAAEEDKRRRNTAASARFRIKKKLKEQEVERNTKQMQNRIDDLETKLRQLQMENKWLKSLVVERNEARDVSSIEQLRQKVLGDPE